MRMNTLCAAAQMLVIREPEPGFFERYPALLILIVLLSAVIIAAEMKK